MNMKGMLELSEQYGNIVGIRILWQNYVILNNEALINEAFQLGSFSGRSRTAFHLIDNPTGAGINNRNNLFKYLRIIQNSINLSEFL